MNLFRLFASHNLTVLAIWNPDGSVNITAQDKWGMSKGAVFFRPAKPLDEALEKLAVCCGINS